MVSRSYYIDDFTDETLPCAPRLSSWAEFLTSDGGDYDGFLKGSFPFPDGETFATQAIRWLDDIGARKVDGEWALSRQPEGEADFFAIRDDAGCDWSAEDIIHLKDKSDTLLAAFQRYLTEWGCGDEDHVYIAVGVHEPNWQLTLHHGNPPSCTAGPRQ